MQMSFFFLWSKILSDIQQNFEHIQAKVWNINFFFETNFFEANYKHLAQPIWQPCFSVEWH